jgi:hypothetical protein
MRKLDITPARGQLYRLVETVEQLYRAIHRLVFGSVKTAGST